MKNYAKIFLDDKNMRSNFGLLGKKIYKKNINNKLQYEIKLFIDLAIYDNQIIKDQNYKYNIISEFLSDNLIFLLDDNFYFMAKNLSDLFYIYLISNPEAFYLWPKKEINFINLILYQFKKLSDINR